MCVNCSDVAEVLFAVPKSSQAIGLPVEASPVNIYLLVLLNQNQLKRVLFRTGIRKEPFLHPPSGHTHIHAKQDFLTDLHPCPQACLFTFCSKISFREVKNWSVLTKRQISSCTKSHAWIFYFVHRFLCTEFKIFFLFFFLVSFLCHNSSQQMFADLMYSDVFLFITATKHDFCFVCYSVVFCALDKTLQPNRKMWFLLILAKISVSAEQR